MVEGDRFLVVDVGGTKALLFLVRYENKKPIVIKKKAFLCKDHISIEEVILLFLEEESGVKRVVIGAAGTVLNGRCFMTNLSWIIDKKLLEKKLKIESIMIINDLELLTSGLSFLEEKDLLVLQKGKETGGKVKALISVGTGLGEGVCFDKKVFATEGGHCDFAPSSKEEISFLSWMKERYSHVSYERVLSGEGIQNIYEFFTKERGVLPEEIFQGKSAGTRRTISFFLTALGREAGNLALRTLSFGGIYLSGGILEKNPLLLQREEFLEAFCDKGRFSDLLKNMHVTLIKGDGGVLYGGLGVLLESKK